MKNEVSELFDREIENETRKLAEKHPDHAWAKDYLSPKKPQEGQFTREQAEGKPTKYPPHEWRGTKHIPMKDAMPTDKWDDAVTGYEDLDYNDLWREYVRLEGLPEETDADKAFRNLQQQRALAVELDRKWDKLPYDYEFDPAFFEGDRALDRGLVDEFRKERRTRDIPAMDEATLRRIMADAHPEFESDVVDEIRAELVKRGLMPELKEPGDDPKDTPWWQDPNRGGR